MANFYREQCFIRFAIVDNSTGKAVGTIEGFGGETGVHRVDIASDYEKCAYLSEIFATVKNNFYHLFKNQYIVTKAVKNATERRQALTDCGWEFIDLFREYGDYYRIGLC